MCLWEWWGFTLLVPNQMLFIFFILSPLFLSLSLSPSFSFSVALTISISFSVAFFLCLCDFQSFFLFYMAVHFACRVLCSNAALESKSNICYSLSSVLLLTRYCCRCGLVLIFFFQSFVEMRSFCVYMWFSGGMVTKKSSSKQKKNNNNKSHQSLWYICVFLGFEVWWIIFLWFRTELKF